MAPGPEPRRASLRHAGLHADPVALALVVAGVCALASGSPVLHELLLFGAAAALVRDRRRISTTPAWPHDVPERRRLSALTVTCYAVVVAGFRRFTWPVTVSIGTPGVAAVARAARTRPRARTHGRISRLGIGVWATLLVSGALWELVTLLLQPSWRTSSWAHPTLSTLLDPALENPLGRIAGILLWAAAGLWLVDR